MSSYILTKESTHPDLRPDIEIRVGCVPDACDMPGCTSKRSIYQLVDDPENRILCRTCASKIQAVLNRLRDR